MGKHHVINTMRFFMVFVSMMFISGNAIVSAQGQNSTSSTNSSYSDYAPYAHFIKYHYTGANNSSRDVIMEYVPDSQGLFQVTVWENQRAICYVYQIRKDGVYEVARFESYSDVEDKRNSAVAKDNEALLQIPKDLTVGYEFQSSNENETKSKVVANNLPYTINEQRYENTLKIENNTNGTISYHYYAPKVGLIAIEDASGNPQLLLTETYGSIHTN